MVKFKWNFNKIQIQRAMILSIIGMISFGIIKSHMEYEKKVSEYMRSLEYRQAREASHDYNEKLMKRNQQSLLPDESASSGTESR